MFLAAAGVTAAMGTAASAATYGGVSTLIARDCSGIDAAAACAGRLPILAQSITGGVGSTSDGVLDLGDGSHASGQVAFGGLDLPLIRGYTSAVGNVRVGSSNLGFQSFTYTGDTPIELSYAGLLHIVDSSGGGLTGATLPGGVLYGAYLAIWDPSVIAGLSSAADLSNLLYPNCGDAGVFAAGGIGGTGLAGGEESLAVSTVSCSGSPFMIAPGQEILAVAALQLIGNRGGWADATSTFTITLDPTLPEETQLALAAGMVSGLSAVPEPATWAMMVIGFGLVGSASRRARRAGLVAA